MENTPALSDRQKFILGCGKDRKSFQVKDIFEAFSEKFDVKRLTLVRDLIDLEKKGILEKSGKGRAVSYRVSLKFLAREEVDPDRYFSMPLDERNAKPLFDEVVFSLLESRIFSEVEKIRLETVNASYLQAKEKLQKESPAILKREWERLIVELSWKSSEIEGNTYTLLETEALLKEKQHAEGKDKAETQMILNHKKALDFILGRKDFFRDITVEKIKEIHALLVEDIEVKTDFRNHPVGITGTLYRPLPKYRDIDEAMNRMTELCLRTENIFERAFIFLILISYVQPFEDGNKRTARILSNAVLYAHDKSMLSYRSVSAVEYKKALVLFYEQNNISYIKKIFLEQFAFAVENYFGE